MNGNDDDTGEAAGGAAGDGLPGQAPQLIRMSGFDVHGQPSLPLAADPCQERDLIRALVWTTPDSVALYENDPVFNRAVRELVASLPPLVDQLRAEAEMRAGR